MTPGSTELGLDRTITYLIESCDGKGCKAPVGLLNYSGREGEGGEGETNWESGGTRGKTEHTCSSHTQEEGQE